MNTGLFFCADYRDGRVRIGNKTYPAGHYCVHLLNQYYKEDTAARISVFTNRNWQLQEQLKAGYLNIGDYTKHLCKSKCKYFGQEYKKNLRLVFQSTFGSILKKSVLLVYSSCKLWS